MSSHDTFCLAPELSEETFPTLLLISKLMKVLDSKVDLLCKIHIFKDVSIEFDCYRALSTSSCLFPGEH